MTSNGYFDAIDDQTIRFRMFFEEIGLLRPLRLQRPLRSIRLKRFLMLGKPLLRTSDSSRFLNSIIWGLYLMFWKKKSFDRIIKIHVDFSTFSVGGCWGQPMLLFQKLVDETQMPKPQEYTDIFILTKKLFLVGLWGLQSISNPVERPCSMCTKNFYDIY